MKPVYLSRLSSVLFSLLSLVSGTALAQQAKLPMVLHPAPGMTAHIDKQGTDYILTQPDGQHVWLASSDDLEPGTDPDFDEEDINYDGHPDLYVGIPVSMVNVEADLYRYDVKSASYQLIELPESLRQRQSCEGLWNIGVLPEQKAIQSSCRSGPS